MAYIKKLTDKPRKLPWRAQVRRKGHKVLVKMFATKAEAEHWTTEQERAIRLTGLPQTIKELERHQVSEIVERYLKEITPTKGCRVSETTVLKKFLRHAFCRKSLASASGPNGTLGGMTFDEAIEKVGAIVLNKRISGKPKAVPLEEAVGHGMMRFNSEEEMMRWVERRKKEYSQPGSRFPFPPQI